MMGCEVDESSIVAIGHDARVRQALGEKVAQPHDLAGFMGPCLDGMAFEAVDSDETIYPC